MYYIQAYVTAQTALVSVAGGALIRGEGDGVFQDHGGHKHAPGPNLPGDVRPRQAVSQISTAPGRELRARGAAEDAVQQPLPLPHPSPGAAQRLLQH